MIALLPDEVEPALAEVQRLTAAGWWAFGFVAYEAAAGLGYAGVVGPPLDGLPLVWFGLSRGPRDVDVISAASGAGYRVGHWACAWNPDDYRRRVRTIRAHIAEGEVYQCNLTTRLSATVDGSLVGFYADLARRQHGAHHAYLDIGRYVISSGSPELFFDLRDGCLTMRPMKGTARRGAGSADDLAIAGRLRADAKERAENIMIVDLVRNDLSQLSTTGSVRVTRLCDVEQYDTVFQLTSEVTGKLRDDVGLPEIFLALFPCGSITGAPKRRSMELIREVETEPRGVYCGAIGVVAPPDAPFRARFNVAIRTAVADRWTGTTRYGSGGGITWDSNPDSEYAEMWDKTRVLPGAGVGRSTIELEKQDSTW